jgi:hypothetical protein
MLTSVLTCSVEDCLISDGVPGVEDVPTFVTGLTSSGREGELTFCFAKASTYSSWVCGAESTETAVTVAGGAMAGLGVGGTIAAVEVATSRSYPKFGCDEIHHFV